MALLVTGALNTRPAVVLRLLTWQSPSLPLGAWIAAAAAGGGALSAAGTALALRDAGPGLRRRVRREPERQEPWEGFAADAWRQGWRGERPESERGGGYAERSRSGGSAVSENPRGIEPPPAWGQSAVAGPDRAPGEPAPTVSVPYRVIRRGRPESPSEPLGSEAPQQRQRGDRERWSGQGVQGRSPEPEPVAVADDWGSDSLDDW